MTPTSLTLTCDIVTITCDKFLILKKIKIKKP